MSYPPNQPDPQQPGGYPQPGQPQGGQPPQQPGYGPAHSTPPPAPSYGAPDQGPITPGGYGAPGQTPMASGGYGAPGGYGDPYHQVGMPQRRPGTVTAGAILTWVGCALMIIMGIIVAVAGGSLDLTEALGDMSGAATGIMVGVGIFLVVAGAIPLVLGILAFKGSKGALIGLTVVGVIWVLLTLVSLFSDAGSGGNLIAVLWIAGATALFWSGRSWYDAPRV